jgi:hypothetical protein
MPNYYADGDAHVPGEDIVPESWDDEVVVFEAFFTVRL